MDLSNNESNNRDLEFNNRKSDNKELAKDWLEKFVSILKVVGKVAVSVPVVIFRVINLLYKSFVYDFVCLFLGPMNLYKHTRPKGWKKKAIFALQVIALEIYNVIALVLNATLGSLYKLVESAFMMFQLWTDEEVAVKQLYRAGGKKEESDKKEESEENDEKREVNSVLIGNFAFGNVDIENKMSKFVGLICGVLFDSAIFEKAISFAIRFVCIGSVTQIKSDDIEAMRNKGQETEKKSNHLSNLANSNDLTEIAKNREGNLSVSNVQEAGKNSNSPSNPTNSNNSRVVPMPVIDSIFSPIKTFRS